MSSIDFSDVLWRKSSYSNGQANCVETAAARQDHYFVAVRDSKAPDAAKLVFAAPVWQQFVSTVKFACKS